MAEVLASVVKDEVVKQHPLTVKHITKPDQVPGCHVLYVGIQEGRDVSRYLQLAAKQNILTVSDNERFVKRGGMVSLVRKGKRIRPLVNISVVKQSKIAFSAKLLGLATLVETQED